jgi:hypothetical protein
MSDMSEASHQLPTAIALSLAAGLHRNCIRAIDYSDANQGPRWTDDSPKSVVPKWGLHDRQFEERSGIAEPPGIYPLNIP